MTERKTLSWLAAVLVLVIVGCEMDDARLVEATREADQRQAAQNQLVAEQTQQVAEGTRRLVEADAQARQQLLSAQSGLDRQRNEIEAERKQLATERHRDPIVGDAITAAAMLIACVLPLLLAIQVLRTLGQRTHDDALAEVLIDEIVSDRAALLSGPNGNDRPALPNASRTSS